MPLRLIEESKIHCAREHFKTISNGEASMMRGQLSEPAGGGDEVRKADDMMTEVESENAGRQILFSKT